MPTRGDLPVEDRARAWLAQDPDPVTRAELAELLRNGDVPELRARFDGRLEFGTAGLRGPLGAGPQRMNRVTVMRAAAGLAHWLGTGRSIVIGYDARHNSARFAQDTAAVATGAGLRAHLLPHPLPTPVLAFAIRWLGADAGVVVTASHNPPQDNGYKVYTADGSQIAAPVDTEIAGAIDAVGPVDELPLGTDWEVLDERVRTAYLDAIAGLPVGDARAVRLAYTPLHGVGRDTALAAFARAGFPAPSVVPEQGDPDPDFPTVAFPNPEEPGALDLALGLGLREGADLVIANDPDADRCAVAVPDGTAHGRPLTGDELGGLLAEQVLAHTSGPDRLVATTVVSSSLLAEIARAHDVRYVETLTGFKWIARADTVPSGPGGRLVFGYEEALGYCVGGDAGPPVRDKDGISAALAAAGLAAGARQRGRTLLDLLDDQARRYGVHATSQLSIRVAEVALIADAMFRLRGAPPGVLAGRTVRRVEDLATGRDGLPPSDVLRYHLDTGARVVIRPSGTEPKLKAYLEVVVPVRDTVDRARTEARASLDALSDAVRATLALDDAG